MRRPRRWQRWPTLNQALLFTAGFGEMPGPLFLRDGDHVPSLTGERRMLEMD